jgi:hypothetical protein
MTNDDGWDSFAKSLLKQTEYIYSTFDVGRSMFKALIALVPDSFQLFKMVFDAAEMGACLRVARLINIIFIRAKTQYGADANSTQAVKLLEDAMNVYLRAPGY